MKKYMLCIVFTHFLVHKRNIWICAIIGKLHPVIMMVKFCHCVHAHLLLILEQLNMFFEGRFDHVVYGL